jgi:hypothetical protein
MLHVPPISSLLFDEPFCINSVLVFVFATRITYKPEQRGRRNKEEQRKKRRTKERKKVRIREKRKRNVESNRQRKIGI